MVKNIASQLTLAGFIRRAASALLGVKPSSYFKRSAANFLASMANQSNPAPILLLD